MGFAKSVDVMVVSLLSHCQICFLCLQHSSLSLFKEMLLTLDLAQQIGSTSDKIAADRLSRRSRFLLKPTLPS